MGPQDLLFWQKATPFRPFRIHMNSGRNYDIRHPEMVRVGIDSVIVFFPGEVETPFDRRTWWDWS